MAQMAERLAVAALASSLALLLGICFPISPLLAEAGDIVFVTQPPLPNDFATINATFANHSAQLSAAPRGGDLYIRYKDGTLRNLTEEAGFGGQGMITNAAGISVRDPVVHWDGAKVLFSMVVGVPSRQYEVREYRWQLYEATGVVKGEQVKIAKVPNQPESYNNVMPAYGSDDAILFISDRPRNGEPHLYPQLDEYESTPTNTGLWRLRPETGELALLDHSPSGDFHPTVDSFGRVVFTRWDHLQRDQQKDAGDYGTFDYSGEGADSTPTTSEVEVFPEPRVANDPDRRAFEQPHRMNHFFPWMINQDGTELETLQHIGRHELAEYGSEARSDDRNLTYIGSEGERTSADLLLHLREDPRTPGRYYGIKAPEFGTHASGQIVSLDGAPTENADTMRVVYLTHPDTANPTTTPSSNHSGLYRTPLMLSTGELIASHTSETREDSNQGSGASPLSRYRYRLTRVTKQGEFLKAEAPLTQGIRKSVRYWQPDFLVQYTDQELWELQPVELLARARPPLTKFILPTIEQKVLDELGVDLPTLRQFLKDRDLALLVTRDVTSRDAADKQQPFNLTVANSNKSTVGAGGTKDSVSHLQILQGDLLRGIGGSDSPRQGRRVLAREMHSLPTSLGQSEEIPGAVRVAGDGSVAAFVPARRAISWQLLGPDTTPIVRERFWITMQPGEIRVCGGCHGANSFNQAGGEPPSNSPEALRNLLRNMTYPPLDSTPGPTPNPDKGKVALRVFAGRSKLPVKAVRRGTAFRVELSGVAGSELTLVGKDGRCKVERAVTLAASGKKVVKGSIPYGTKRGILLLSVVTSAGDILGQLRLSLQPGPTKMRKSAEGKLCSKLLRP